MRKPKKLDLMSISKLVDLFLKEEQKSISSIKNQKNNISKAINLIKQKIKNGRVFYIGSGTSGRIGILDAVECKPTFNTNLFQAIIAGGKSAVFQAKEGSEDNTKQAIKDLKKIRLTKNDTVIGISACGETLYTSSAIKYANKIKALTIAITSNPDSTLSKTAKHKIITQTGEEIISGSSRLKAGTAQKLILNMISTISMIKSTKVYDDLMIDVVPANKKLIKRAIGIIYIICKVPLNKAKLLFRKSNKNIKAAVVMHLKKCSLKEAIGILKTNDYNLRKIIG